MKIWNNLFHKIYLMLLFLHFIFIQDITLHLIQLNRFNEVTEILYVNTIINALIDAMYIAYFCIKMFYILDNYRELFNFLIILWFFKAYSLTFNFIAAITYKQLLDDHIFIIRFIIEFFVVIILVYYFYLDDYQTNVQLRRIQEFNLREIFFNTELNFYNNTCVICFDDFSNGNSCVMLSCRHVYHFTCINRWLQIRFVCPLCNVQVNLSNDI